MRTRWAAFAVASLFASAAAVATLPSFELQRQERTIRVQQTAGDQEGGVFAQRTGCRAEGMALTTVYAPTPKVVETSIDDVVITSNIVLREQPAGDQDKATLEHIAGSLDFNEDTFCPENVTPSGAADVTLRHGRTTIRGSSFTYDNSTGIGHMDGPVELVRTAGVDADADAEELYASADTLEYNVDADATVLSGNVRLSSGGRESEADLVEYDDDAGFAVLRGDPAVSRAGQDVLEGRVIEYDLETNDVVVIKGIRASFELER